MSEIIIEQAVYRRADGEPPQLVARSVGFRADWLNEAAGLAVGFGDRPPGVKCPAAVFAHPLGIDQVIVVQVADREWEQARPAVFFHFSALPQAAYERLFGDPFALARLLPPEWDRPELAAQTLPARTLPAEPLPARTVRDIQRVLKRIKAGALPEDKNAESEPERDAHNSESPALLGGAQVLVDGGRVVFERPAADSGLVPDLWTLLPGSTRCKLWPASFAFGNALKFDALVVARTLDDDYEGYTREEQAAVYPEGRYEYHLQVAAEHDDQAALDALLSRRSWAETWRLGLIILVLVMVLAIVGRVLDILGNGPRAPGGQERPVEKKEKP
jgi:hypothetical protein